MGTNMFRDPFLDQFWVTFLIFENHRIDVRGVMIEIKVQFGDSLETILSASTTNVFSVLTLSEQSIALRAPAVHGVSSKLKNTIWVRQTEILIDYVRNAIEKH